MTQPALKVLMITSQWPIPDGRPRTTHFIKRQADFLRAAGVDVEVFHFTGNKNPWNYLRSWIRVRRRMARNHYDLVHAQFGMSGLLAIPRRRPLVVTFRGDDVQGIVGRNGGITFAGKVLALACRMVARIADASIVVSEHMKAFLPRGVEAQVIPSGLDFGLFRLIPREEARAHLHLPLDRHYVLFVGNPDEPRKNFALAQQALAILERTTPAEMLVAWGTPHTDIPYMMNACDALIHTSRQEGSPNCVKEALACNLPVVSVPVGDVPQRLAGIENCAICDDGRAESLAAALDRVLRDGRRCAGREAVRELDENNITRKVMAVYRSVTRSAPQRESLLEASDALR